MGKLNTKSPGTRAKTVLLRKEFGLSQREIAKKLKISRCAVQTALKNFDNGLHYKDKLRCGRPRKSDERDDRALVRLSERNPFKTAKELRQEWISPLLSKTTVRRRLAKAGLHGRIAVRKPFINEANRIKRLSFAKDHADWTNDDWAKVLWSDESKFEFCTQKKRLSVWRRKTEKFEPRKMQGTVKHGGGSLMIWGCMGANGLGNLEKIDYTLTGVGYRNILIKNLNSSIKNALKNPQEDWFFQQDNDPKHKAKVTMDYFVANGIPLLNWPPQSPDLNPIEHLWNIMKAELLKQKFRAKNRDALFEKLKEIWMNIGIPDCERLVFSMPNRIAAVIKAKGHATKY